MKRALGALLLLLIGAVGGGWWWARQSLPVLRGEIQLPGLNGPVEVLLDPHGVPHVYAAGADDAWFAAGVLHARDRLWQMELYRRAAAGRLSELLGESTIEIDKRFLTLDLRGAAAAEWNGSDPAVRRALIRYAAGVNAQLATLTTRRLPLEFQLLRVRPAEWSPIDTLAVGRLLAWRLAENHQGELVRHALAARFGTVEALRLGGRYPADAPSVVPHAPAALDEARKHEGTEAPRQEGTEARRDEGTETRPAVAETRLAGGAGFEASAAASWPPGLEWLHPNARRGGSNNWVVTGRRTASGRPLLANDPHLQLEFPGVWYEMHLTASDLDVIGVTIPGTPFVILGHNARVAWGMTNTGADVQDLFIDRVDLRARRYWFDGRWWPVQVTRTDIPVRGEEAQRFEVWRTRHGNVLAEVGLDWERAPQWLSEGDERRGERRVFTLRWDVATGTTAGAFALLNRAADWNGFVTAVERFAAPSQNFVYADVAGNIGFAMSGLLPRRQSGVGVLPHDGTVAGNEWLGDVAPSSLPRVLNPARGYVASANNLIDRQWPGLITRDWAAPYRATRLTQLLDGNAQVDLPTAAGWQNDRLVLAAADLLAHSDAALALAERGSHTEASGALHALRAWDRIADDRDVVTLYQLFEDAVWRRTFFDEMGAPLFDKFYEWAGGERPAGLHQILADASSPWFDDIGTLERRETRDDVFLLAADDAARRLAQLPGDRSWGEVHAARFTHPLGSAAAPMGWLFNRGPVALTGDGTTVNRVSYHRLRGLAAWEAPSWRQLFDVGAWDDSQVVLPAGQSGHPLSPHYFDQNERWRHGHYRQQVFSRARVQAAHAHRLVLIP